MKLLAATAALSGVLFVLAGPDTSPPALPLAATDVAATGTPRPSPADLDGVVEHYCQTCHNDRRLRGNMSLEGFQVGDAPGHAELAEKMIVKLRAGMMPPPGARRPGEDTLQALVETLERTIDDAARGHENPGGRTFQRLNQAEYAASIHDLLGMDINAGDYLPPDTKSANFDNIADVQMLSPTLLDAYLNAAAEISRLAVGDPHATPREVTFSVSGYASQVDRVEGAPFGSRGGISAVNVFPADGRYRFKIGFEYTTTGDGFFGAIARNQRLEFSIDGEPAVVLRVDQWLQISDPDGITMETEPVFVRAGPHRVTAAFIRTSDGPVEDLMSPFEWSIADRHTGINGYGLTALPHLSHLTIDGPRDVTGVSETPIRDRIFVCRPTTPAEERPCARRIVSRLASEAYRRPLEARDVDGLMAFYEQGAAESGFEEGIRKALQAVLSSPWFVFRLETPPPDAVPGKPYRLGDVALASRLSFFLWGAPPDDALLKDAEAGKLSTAEGIEAETRTMLKDPRASALGTRFAAQWLRLQDLDKVHPDSYWYPDYDQQLADAMKSEVELFFDHLVQADRPFPEFFTADYTFVNERLAKHYGIPGIVGEDFQKVQLSDPARQGILGKGAVLTLTSHANRTSPVLRGKWVMEVLMGTPPPPPPPGVPALEETKGAKDGRQLTTRERMEMHRASPTCSSCHSLIDPIGLALDNFDVTGSWRIRENNVPLDTRGEFYDGTPIASPADLRTVLLKRPIPLIRTFTENLMAYALGRRVEYYDMPTIRQITKQAKANDYRMSSFILGVVTSDAFRMQTAPAVAQDDNDQSR